MKHTAKATPTKEFFVRMITRDIALEDCILDLIDNCLDGAQRSAPIDVQAGGRDYSGFRVAIQLEGNEFTIRDNCGGISLDIAIDYAFHFGRRPDTPDEAEYAIGLYGIGMKRAILKIGKLIEIHSSTPDEAFVCTLNVDDWLKHDRWEFELDDAPHLSEAGTRIAVRDLNPGVAEEFGDESFVNHLCRVISRDYVRFLDRGLEIKVNGKHISGYGYAVRESADFKAYRSEYDDDGVRVEIIAGMAAPPPADLQPSERPDTGYSGWFVFCNDRVVLPADKTERTVWGDDQFPRWHYQYNGFMGMVLFHSQDPRQLPWTTTKRNVDDNSPLYRWAVRAMKAATRPWIEYTNQRKADLENARAQERLATKVPVFQVDSSSVLKVPTPPSKPKVQMANILYVKPLAEVQRVRRALGRGNMSYRAVGEKTFDYYVENEVED